MENVGEVMMKRLLLPLLAVLIVPAAAQTDYTRLSVTYEVEYLRYAEDNYMSKDIAQLDIGEHASRYYSLVHEWYKVHNEGKSPYSGTTSRREDVFKNMPDKGQLTFIHMPFWITTVDTIAGLFNWQLEEGDSVICSYPCKRASADFRGRKWIVWYSLDLPYSDGPWKFCGLPGLILSAEDSSNQFSIHCIGIKKGDGHEICYPSGRLNKVVSPERLEELLILEAEDEPAYHSMMLPGGGKIIMSDRNGRLISNIHWTAVPYEVFQQNHKKKPVKKKPATKKRRRR
jgi:GLPGLI family protein